MFKGLHICICGVIVENQGKNVLSLVSSYVCQMWSRAPWGSLEYPGQRWLNRWSRTEGVTKQIIVELISALMIIESVFALFRLKLRQSRSMDHLRVWRQGYRMRIPRQAWCKCCQDQEMGTHNMPLWCYLSCHNDLGEVGCITQCVEQWPPVGLRWQGLRNWG